METLQRERTSQDRLGAIVSGVFAVFGLVLAGFSLYGLLSYSVELRAGEMGVRMALGASRRSILALILGQAATRLLAGTADRRRRWRSPRTSSCAARSRDCAWVPWSDCSSPGRC